MAAEDAEATQRLPLIVPKKEAVEVAVHWSVRIGGEADAPLAVGQAAVDTEIGSRAGEGDAAGDLSCAGPDDDLDQLLVEQGRIVRLDRAGHDPGGKKRRAVGVGGGEDDLPGQKTGGVGDTGFGFSGVRRAIAY